MAARGCAADPQAKREKRKRREMKVKSRLRAAQATQAEGIADDPHAVRPPCCAASRVLRVLRTGPAESAHGVRPPCLTCCVARGDPPAQGGPDQLFNLTGVEVRLAGWRAGGLAH